MPPLKMAVAGAVLGFVGVVACSNAAGAEPCKDDGDCESGSCALNGLCAPGECECNGSDCGKVRSSCAEGSVCVKGSAVFELGYHRCFATCDATKACSASTRCSEGICRDAPKTFALAWVNIPRPRACTSRLPCEYRARPSEGVQVETYTWRVGAAPPVETKEPAHTVTYETGGTYEVVLRARAADGATAELRANEVLCDGSVGQACNPDGPACCDGTCGLTKICR